MKKKIFTILQDKLKIFNISESCEELAGETTGIAVLHNRFTILNALFGRRLCAIVDVPGDITTEESLRNLCSAVRQSINKHFVGIAFYRNVHTFIVFICSQKLFEKAEKMAKDLVDRTVLHSTILEGIIFVDRDNCNIISHCRALAHGKRLFRGIISSLEQFPLSS